MVPYFPLETSADLSSCSLEEAVLKSGRHDGFEFLPVFTLHVGVSDKKEAHDLLSGFSSLVFDILIDHDLQRYEWYIVNNVTKAAVGSKGP